MIGDDEVVGGDEGGGEESGGEQGRDVKHFDESGAPTKHVPVVEEEDDDDSG